MIPKETVELIIETARIDEVVGDYVSLKKRGTNLIGLCPFHNEKTPSFNVNPARGIYKCFGCGQAGNAVNFVMSIEHLSYPEALRQLAKKYNITIEEEVKSEETIRQDSERESLFVVSTFAQQHFTHNLFHTDEGQSVGLSYFKERGFSMPTIEKFQLGYAPESFDDLTKTAKEKGYQLDILEKCGLVKHKDERYLDFFRGRVIFPIHNVTGKVIAFGARTLRSDKKEPKYLNSPETEIYVKSNILFGIHHAKRAIIATDNCYLVEGYTDVISMHQTGIENVVASSGTSLTTGQIRLIKRYTQNITILYDGDSAGIKASFRGIDMILEEGMNVRVLLFPDGEDPDSFSKKVSTEEYHEFIRNNTKDFILFKTDILLKEANNDPVKKAALIKDLVSSIALVPDTITRQVYTKECSKLFEIGEQTLITEVNKSRRAKSGKESGMPIGEIEVPEIRKTPEQVVSTIDEELHFQERDLARILLNYADRELEFEITIQEEEIGADGKHKTHKEILQTSVAQYILHQMDQDELTFDDEDLAFILNEYRAYFSKGVILNQQHFINQPGKVSQVTIDLVVSPYQLSKKWKEKHLIYTKTEDEKLAFMVKNALYSYKLKKVMQMIHRIQSQLKEKMEEEEVDQRLEDMTFLFEAKKKLSEELGRVIIK